MGFVYLILQIDSNGLETHKIGISKNDPKLRVKQLATGNPNEISLLNCYESDNYKKVERLMHHKYSGSKTLAENEWFNLSNEDVITFIDNCKKFNERVEYMKINNPFYK